MSSLEEAITRLSAADQTISVIALQETFLSAEQRFTMEGYAVYRQDRSRRVGGTVKINQKGITAPSTVNTRRMQTEDTGIETSTDNHQLVTPELQQTEATSIETSTDRNIQLQIFSVYLRPSKEPTVSSEILTLNPRCETPGPRTTTEDASKYT